ncbi:DEAD/DEAH box helicase [Microbacterium lushaniae]|uniref:Restriction endonuclease subunit R n=1 Tax=Microbacterium lushaniae TaxID=2614639 RepID=A0A5J6L5B8_9MICO|nr:DEAD/DEAH box helicase family protein [Microbacterium lushaniae]QEW03758.1 restriction endonuclease subunit R [Microbacterium lushaniae]
MHSTKITTFGEIIPLIYSWTTPDIPKYAGWEKIGYTEQGSADARIDQQASQLSVEKQKLWAMRALFLTEEGGRFTDADFHRYLRQQGIERETTPKRTEWHKFDGAPKTSLDFFKEFASQDLSSLSSAGTHEDYELREEQQDAVTQAIEAFDAGHTEVLWNAKPRFGKTLTTYDLVRQLDISRVLIVTNRPAIGNSWFDDFARFIGHQTAFQFVSESESITGQRAMTRKQWRDYTREPREVTPRLIEFVSLQDLKGSKYFGGSLNKLEHIASTTWDLLVVDESHEGVDTRKTEDAFRFIKRARTLYLSGTPFKALAGGRFASAEQVFNWTYEDEQSARERWSDASRENPYAALPRLNLFTYQISRMISDRLAEGVAVEEDAENIDFAFSLNEFFATKDNGYFEHEDEVKKFLDRLAQNEKYPFSTPELRDEIRHSFWLLNRVASAKALQRLLKEHEVFKDYDVILAAGDGRSYEDEAGDSDAVNSSLGKVRAAIDRAEKSNGKTITLSVGQLTTGVTVPQWTAVIMLSDIASPARYIQAAFRAQNPCTFERAGHVYRKQNAYIFDFAPERTLVIYDEFANDLRASPTGDHQSRQESIRTLLNFLPVIGEDSDGEMMKLDAADVLTFPKVFKAREVVRRGFLSNLLFANVGGIFRYSEHVAKILEKLPTAEQGKLKHGQPLEMPDPAPSVDDDGVAKVDLETVINPKVAELGKPVWRIEDIPVLDADLPIGTAAERIAKAVSTQLREKREALKAEYKLTARQIDLDEKRTEQAVKHKVERAYVERTVARHRLDDEKEDAAEEKDFLELEAKQEELDKAFEESIISIYRETMESFIPEVVGREEQKKEQKRANKTMDDARAHLRGFARTIPMFLMAYGDQEMRLANFDSYTPDHVFAKVTGITEEEFRLLRDGQRVKEPDGTIVEIPGLFDEDVFDQSIQEFLEKKRILADYFDDSQTENIFAYIPKQKTSLVFPPQTVVQLMVDIIDDQNPGIFSDPEKTFADVFSTAGIFLLELVRRLNTGLVAAIPDDEERLRHILTTQIFELSNNEILHDITIEAVSGGIPERREWLVASGHYDYGNLAAMSAEERRAKINSMLNGER